MKRIKAMIFGLIVGMSLGIWFGFNMGQDRPLLSNPFSEPTFQQSIKKTGETLIEKGGEMLERGGQALQDQPQEEEFGQPPLQPPPQ